MRKTKLFWKLGEERAKRKNIMNPLKYFIAFVILVVIFQISTLNVWAFSGNEWLLFHHDEKNTRCSTSSIPEKVNLGRLWDTNETDVLDFEEFFSTLEISPPLIIKDKVIISVFGVSKTFVKEGLIQMLQTYFGIELPLPLEVLSAKKTLATSPNITKVYVLSLENGEVIAELPPLPGQVILAANNNKLFIGMKGIEPVWKGGLTCLDIDSLDVDSGIAEWENSNIHPNYGLTVANDKVFVDSIDSEGIKLSCLDANNGQEIWEYRISGEHITGPPAVASGKVFFTTDEYKLYCLDVNTGEEKWPEQKIVDFYVFGIKPPTPPVVANGKIYVSSGSTNPESEGIYCFDENDGSEVCKYSEMGLFSSLAVTPDGKIYARHEDKIYCLEQKDDKLERDWEFTVDSNAVVNVNNKVLVSELDSDFNLKLYCLDGNNGSVIWTEDIEEGSPFSFWNCTDAPRIANGKIFMGLSNPEIEINPTTWATKNMKLISLGTRQVPTATADVALIIDSSGSMEDNDPNYLRRDAAKFFIDLAEPGTQIAVVDFDAGARTYASLTPVDVPENKQALKNAVDRVNSDGGTDLGRGLKQGYNELVASAFPDVKKAGVMLTDGIGDYSNQASLYADKGWSVYTVGLSKDVDENLLRRIAESTPEGEYFSASRENMQTIYNLILARVTDKSILSNYKGFINQGQEVFKDVFIDLVEQVIFAINWQGSKIDLVLIDPDSNEINPADTATNPNIDYKESSTFAIYTVNSPTSGEWKMKAKGTDIPPEGEQYNLTVTATSDLITNLLALEPSYSVGDTVRIGIRIKEKIGDTSEPVLGATASAEIVRPDGRINSLELFDDGSHNDMKAGDGVYANSYTNVDKEGKYLIRVNATNDFSREIQDEVIVGAIDNVYIDGGTLTPPAGATLDKSPDIISAVISGPAGNIDEGSIELKLDNQTVQHSYDAVNQVVSYQPPEVLPGGQHTVNLSLKDTNGRPIETTWTFTTPQTLVNVSAESAFADRKFLISVLSEAGAEVLADLNELNVDITEPIMLKAGETVEEGTRYTGVVKVNVKEVGIKTFTVTVQNKAGRQISKDFSVEVLPLTHSEFTISLARGINLMSLPLKLDKVRISGLAELIGPELKMIIHHQPQANRFVGYEPTDSPGSKYDAQIAPASSYIVVMDSPKQITFKGTTWGNYLELKKGLNFISLPLEPDTPWTIEDLAEFIGSKLSQIIAYNRKESRFVGYSPGALDKDTPITGEEGYILSMKDKADVTFTGKVWQNELTVASPPIVLRNDTNSLPIGIIKGSVVADHFDLSARLKVTVKNLTVGWTEEADMKGSSNKYVVIHANLPDNQSINVGDSVEATILDESGTFDAETVRYTVKEGDIERGVILIPKAHLRKIPDKTVLLPCYPNPFNPDTWIPFKLSDNANVVISIFDVQGQLVRKIELGNLPAGIYVSKDKAVYWDGRNSAGERVSSGIYFYHLKAGDYSATKRMLILK